MPIDPQALELLISMMGGARRPPRRPAFPIGQAQQLPMRYPRPPMPPITPDLIARGTPYGRSLRP
jgi:hypothetical protein